jgi:hypothetical protein
VEDHRRVHATIALTDHATHELSSLYSWLQRNDELRGRIDSGAAESKPGDTGSATELLTVALSSDAAATRMLQEAYEATGEQS